MNENNLIWRTAEQKHSLGDFSAARDGYMALMASQDYNLRASIRLIELNSPKRSPLKLNELEVVWQTGSHGEESIVRELFSRLKICEEFDDSDLAVQFHHRYSKLSKNMIVVDHRIFDQRSLQYYAQARLSGANIILVHLADEGFLDLHEIYDLCRIVYRNYWSPILAARGNVRFFPLGVNGAIDRNAILHERAMAARQYVWNFVGDTNKDSRRGIVEKFRNLTPNKTHLVNDFFDPNKIGPGEYQAIVADSKFTLCPDGFQNCDTFRFWEAIELGSIPVSVTRNDFRYFQNLLQSELPFPQFVDWDEALQFMSSVAGNHFYLQHLQMSIAGWWGRYKRKISEEFRQACVDLSQPAC